MHFRKSKAFTVTRIEVNDLQKQLYIEVINATMPAGSGEYLARRPEVVRAWLVEMKPTLSALAGLGRAAVGGGRSDRDTMLVSFCTRLGSLPDHILRWLDRPCLAALLNTEEWEALSDDECRSRFQTLATLDADL